MNRAIRALLAQGLSGGVRLVLLAVLAVSAVLTLAPAQAQQDPEHDAIARALRVRQPSDPAWQALLPLAANIYPWPEYNKPTNIWPANARVFDQQFHIIVFRNLPWAYSQYFGISLMSFGSAEEAQRNAASTTAGETLFYFMPPHCKRIVGGRHVIAIRGWHLCRIAGWQPRLNEILNVLAAQASGALLPGAPVGRPPVTQPPVTAPPVTATPTTPPEDFATVPPDAEPPAVSETVEEAGSTDDTVADLTPEEIATVSGLAGGAALLGSLLTLGATGVRREEALRAIRDLLRGRIAEDPYEAWKRKYAALGWKYSEKDGVGTFDPVDGARNEVGEVYSAERGGFVRTDEGPRIMTSARDGDVNERGEVWSDNDGGWVQRAYYDQERARAADLERSRAGEIAEAERVSREESDAYSRETARLADQIAADRAARAAAAAADAAQRDAIATRLRNAITKDGGDTAEVERLAAAGDTDGLKALYADHLKRVMDASTAEAAAQKRWADVMAVGEYASKATVAAAKTGLMVLAGPAGVGALGVAGGVGAIASAEEGTRAVVTGQSAAKVAGAFAAGFLSGAKDGAVGRYINLPGVPPLTKVLLPAGADAGEAFVRSGGDVQTALVSGALSAAGGGIGHKLGSIGNVATREGAQVLLGGTMGALGRAATDGKVAEGFVDGLVGSIGATAGGRAANARLGSLTAADIKMDQEAAANAAKGKALVEDLKHAVANGTPEQQKAAVQRVLENRDAKLQLKGAHVDDDTKAAFATLTEEHRTKPLFEGTAAHLNGQTVKTKDGMTTPRFVVREPDLTKPSGFTEREVRPTDFKSGSGSAGAAPGMDLDMYAGARIIDTTTGRAVKPEHLEAAVNSTCDKLGISKSGQEINVIHGTHAEAFTMRPGETPKDVLARVRTGDITGSEGRSVSEVTRFKLDDANVLHGGKGSAGAVSEQCRTAIKDHDRITADLIKSKQGARLPEVFTRRDAVSGETPMDIMRGVAEGRIPPGTGNARFRAATGMDLPSGAAKLGQIPEFVAKIGATGKAPVEGAGLTFRPGMHPGEVGTDALRQALRIGLDEARRGSPQTPN